MKTDDLGNRIKSNYESPETSRRIAASEIIYARIDGRGFSRFTKPFTRPFDMVFATLMQKTAVELVAEFQATIGYVQSDEISLIFHNANPESTHHYDGRYQKLVSTLAATATSFFTLSGLETIHRDHILAYKPTFDARVFPIPSQEEAANTLLWRSLDCLKNAKSQYARHYLSPRAMHNKSGNEMVALVQEKHCADFETIDSYYKYGHFYRAEPVWRELPDEIYSKIPKGKRPESRLVQRNEIKSYCLNFRQITNRSTFIFEGALPQKS